MERTVQQEAAWLINPANNAKDYVFNIARAHGVPEGYLDVYAHAYVSAILTIAYSEEAARVIADWKE